LGRLIEPLVAAQCGAISAAGKSRLLFIYADVQGENRRRAKKGRRAPPPKNRNRRASEHFRLTAIDHQRVTGDVAR